MLRRLVELIQPIALQLGGPGLLLIAFLDSSFLSFPEVPDFLLVWFTVRHPGLWFYYAGLATAGSVAGCYALYATFRRGGEALLHKRFRRERFERALGIIRRYGVLAVLVPSLLPPPAPFKIFVILAGASAIPARKFLIAVSIGRGLRYFAEALLAYFYGEAAMKYISENLGPISLWIGVAIAVMGLAYVIWRRRSQPAGSVEH